MLGPNQCHGLVALRENRSALSRSCLLLPYLVFTGFEIKSLGVYIGRSQHLSSFHSSYVWDKGKKTNVFAAVERGSPHCIKSPIESHVHLYFLPSTYIYTYF